MAHHLSIRLQRDEPAILPLVGPSRAMRELAQQVELLAQGDQTTALLIGETGTDKGRLAEYIHARSARSPRVLMDVERAHIHRTLRAHKLNRIRAARELGISLSTLIKKIKEYGFVYRSPGRA